MRSMFKATNKAEAGRKLVSINQDIQHRVKEFNSIRSLPILLCLEDAINNLEIRVQKARKVEKKFDKFIDRYFAIVNCITQWYDLIDKMILDINEKGFKDPSTKIKIEAISFGISLEKDYELDIRRFENELREEGLIGKNPIILVIPRIFLDKYPGAMFFILKKGTDKHFRRTFDKLISLRTIYYKQAILNTMIYNYPEGTELTFGEKGSVYVKVPDGFEPETIFKKFGIDQRSVVANTPVSVWNSDFLEVSYETLRETLDEKGTKNLEFLKKEDAEIFKAYNSMPGFAEYFEDLYGVQMASFFKIRYELFRMCYSNLHTVGIWTLSRLLKKLNQKTGYSHEIIEKVVELSGFAEKYPNLITVDDIAMTSFRRLSVSRFSLLQNCFNDYYENDLKGKSFEKACRKLLKDNNFNTLPSRVDVFEPMLPLEISQKLWGKQKAQTDIDVIASMKNNVFVIECKEIKLKLPRLREQNQFKKYLVEQYYRVKWISEDFLKFRKYLSNSELKSLSIDFDRQINFFPLVLTNRVINIESASELPLVTYTEFKNSITKKWNMNIDGENGISEIEISGRIFRFPCFVKSISNTV